MYGCCSDDRSVRRRRPADRRHFAQRNSTSRRRADEDVSDLRRRRPVLRQQPHDEIERLFTLNNLRRRAAADRGFDEAVDRRGRSRPSRASFARSTVTVSDGCPSSCTSVTFVMPRTFSSRCLSSSPFVCSTLRSVPNTFTSSELFSPVSASSTASSARLRVVGIECPGTPRVSYRLPR